MKQNLLLCTWFRSANFFGEQPIFLQTIFIFCNTLIFLSDEPIPQFKLLYIPVDLPPFLLKKPCFISLNLLSFFEQIRT